MERAIKKRIGYAAVSCMALLLVFFCGIRAEAADTTKVQIKVQYGQTEARKLMDKVNGIRKTDGKTELTYDYALEKHAMQRAAEMALVAGSTRPNGQPGYMLYKDETPKGFYAECPAVYETSAADVFDQWNGLSSYRTIMLDSRYTAVAAGHVVYAGSDYWVMILRTANLGPTATTANDSTGTAEIDVLTTKITKTQLRADKTEITVTCGESALLPAVKAEITVTGHWPDDEVCVVEADATWEIEDKTYASLSGNQITGLKAGTTKLTATAMGKTLTVSLTVKEKEETVTYKINYQLNGGVNNSENPATGSSDQKIVLKDPTRSGCYTFAGWFTDERLTKKITEIPIGNKKDVNLYAKWKEKEHTFDNGKVTKEPTCSATGVKTYTCTVCGATKKETLKKTDHTYKEKVVKATLSADGKITLACSVCGDVKSSTVISRPKDFKLSAETMTYNGRERKPTVSIKDAAGSAVAAGNYTLTYAAGCKDVGRYGVTVTFKGNYSGSKTLYFTINPASVKLKSLTAGSRKITVKWAKNTKQVTGYEIAYSTKKSFDRSATKTATVKKSGTASKALTGLKAKQKYFVRIRTYKTVSGKKYYSGWSNVKNVTTKK